MLPVSFPCSIPSHAFPEATAEKEFAFLFFILISLKSLNVAVPEFILN